MAHIIPRRLPIAAAVPVVSGSATLNLGAGGGGNSITTLSLTSAASSGTHPFMVGHGFKKGDVASGTSIVTDTSGVTLRTIIKRRWNDGSVKHAILVGSAALTQNVAKVVTLKTGTGSGGSNLTSSNIQAVAPTASVQMGAIGTVSLSSLLATPHRTWVSTPEMVECHYRATVGADANLVVWFHVRLWESGRVWIRAIAENGFVGTSPTLRTYNATVIIGGVTIFNASVNHHQWSRWDQFGWIGGDPQIIPKHTALYLRQTKLVPNYWKTNPSNTKLNEIPQDYDPTVLGEGYKTDTSDTGSEGTFIGPLPNWDALYCTSTDPRAYTSCIAKARGANAWSLYRKSSSTNCIPRPSDFPTTTYQPPNGSERVQSAAYTWDVAHAPNEGYLAYLITGDYYFYETMGHTAQTWYFNHRSAAGSGTSRHWRNDYQNRAIAWGTGIMGGFCAIAPNISENAADLAVVADYQAYLNFLATDWLAQINLPGQNQLGVPYAFSTGSWNGPGSLATWMTNYWTQTNGRVSDLEPLSDMTAFNQVRNWMYRWTVGTFGPTGANNYYFAYAANYGVIVDPKLLVEFGADEQGFYDSWGDVFTATEGHVNNETTNNLQGGSASNPTEAPNGYWGYAMASLAMAVDHGAVGALAGYRRFTGATNFNLIDSSGFDDTPIFGWTPRTHTSVLANAANSLAAGQCIRLPITITDAQAQDEGNPVWKWGSSGCWDPTTRKGMVVCKRQDAGHGYKFWTYDEANNVTGFINLPPDPGNQSGHGYDHSAIDPEQGEFFARLYNDDSGPYKLTTSTNVWTKLPAIGLAMTDASSLTFVPNLGLLAVDLQRIRQYQKSTNAWSTLVTLGGPDSNHSVSEYNPISKVLLMGAGNNSDALKMMDCVTLAVTSIPTPPFNVGAGETQGLLIADPAGPGFIANEKGTANWAFWKPGDGSWTTLSQSSGSGATATNGRPNLTTGAGNVGYARISIPISNYGVMMFLEFVGGAEVARIWLYRHT